MKLAAGMMLVGAMWSCGVHAAVPGIADKTLLSNAPHATSREASTPKPMQKQKIKPAEKVEQKVQEAPKASTVVTPEATNESIQLKGIRG
jgi:cell division septation protein DedD